MDGVGGGVDVRLMCVWLRMTRGHVSSLLPEKQHPHVHTTTVTPHPCHTTTHHPIHTTQSIPAQSTRHPLHSQLEELEEGIHQQLQSGEAADPEYWTAVLESLTLHKV